MARMDLTGKRYGKLRVIRYSYSKKNYDAMWVCLCDCGNIVVVRGADLKRGHTVSCGCVQRERASIAVKTHGKTGTRIYTLWRAMIDRCALPSNKRYENYGGRGITVCEEWQEFMPFYEWAVANGYTNELTIDRIDVNGNYEPSNCRWVDMKTQQNNRRNNHLITYCGRTQTIAQWADELGLDKHRVYNRINELHWDPERALTTPTKRKSRGLV